MLYLMLALALCIVAFLVVLFPYTISVTQETNTIKIPTNASADNVRDSLTKYFGEKYAGRVMNLTRLRKVDFSKRNGAYEITAGTSAFSAMRKLTSGAQTPLVITINGFRSLPLLVDKISTKLEFPDDSLWHYLSSPEEMAKYGLSPDNAMALFIDDSYQFYWSASPKEVLDKFAKNYRVLWSEGNQKKARMLGLTPPQVMILASIVDEETNNMEEKGTIGRLYINRLDRGMPLQADPTIRFALKDYTIRRVLKEDLNVESRYNTYTHKGLPPGPIRTTSRETVTTILDSKPNEYLYMCANEDFSGTHNFASSYEEHLQNAQRYRDALNERGINR